MPGLALPEGRSQGQISEGVRGGEGASYVRDIIGPHKSDNAKQLVVKMPAFNVFPHFCFFTNCTTSLMQSTVISCD